MFTQSLYDISDIQTISRGNNDFVMKMLKMFVDYTPHNVKEMKEKYAAKDLKGLGELAHMIKPTIDSMGISSLKDIIREIEKLGRDGEDKAELSSLLQQVETIINSVIDAIKKDFHL